MSVNFAESSVKWCNQQRDSFMKEICTTNQQFDILDLPANPEFSIPCAKGLYRPEVPDYIKPIKNTAYLKFNDAVKMYRHYARESGFSIKFGTETMYDDSSIRKKHVRCSRYGSTHNQIEETESSNVFVKKKKNSFFKVTGCKAMIGLHRDDDKGTYTIYKFVEDHNHPLNKEEELIFSSQNRRLHICDKIFIIKASTLNIGATKAHGLKAALVGGYGNLRPSKIEFKNFWRDYTCLVGPTDAQCVVDNLLSRRDTWPNFFCKYKLNGKALGGIMWADETCKYYYSKFNDIISIDATYRTNKHKMVYVPFTGINNHHKNVTVGAALLADEKIDSYVWLLEAFVEAHGIPPTVILSDQDPALTQAISQVLPNTKHRLCMWHIMSKLQNKISDDTVKNEEFRSQIHKLVWNTFIDRREFERRWKKMLAEFGLRKNKWLNDMYAIRFDWIPAYFRDIPMCGLMKTTSRSESSNSFFNGFVNCNNLLVNFMLNYDTAISKQRHEQCKLDATSNNTRPKWLSGSNPLQLEEHAARVYTREKFLKIQKQLHKALTLCFQKKKRSGNLTIYTIAFNNIVTGEMPEYKVSFNAGDHDVSCSCGMFTQFGLQCCHVFRVYLDNDVQKIPDKYILHRWRKDVVSSTQFTIQNSWSICNTETSRLIEEAYNAAEGCINAVAHDIFKLRDLIEKLKLLRLECEEQAECDPKKNDIRYIVENIMGLKIPNKIDIEVPKGIRNKGGGKRTRMVSAAEKMRMRALKPKRHCNGCDSYVHHDSRTCPVNPSQRLRPHKKYK